MDVGMEFDAVVIGAGPAGAVAARTLAAAGWQVALVEKSEFPRAKLCGEFLSTPSLAVLDGAGIGEAFRDQAGPAVTRIGLFAGEVAVAARPARISYGHALNRAMDVRPDDEATRQRFLAHHSAFRNPAGGAGFGPAGLQGASPQ